MFLKIRPTSFAHDCNVIENASSADVAYSNWLRVGFDRPEHGTVSRPRCKRFSLIYGTPLCVNPCMFASSIEYIVERNSRTKNIFQNYSARSHLIQSICPVNVWHGLRNSIVQTFTRNELLKCVRLQSEHGKIHVTAFQRMNGFVDWRWSITL